MTNNDSDLIPRLAARFYITSTLVLMCGFAYAGQNNDGFVYDINRAPIVADGDVAYRQADYVIDLVSADDPTDPGIDMQSGDQLRVSLPSGTMPENLTDFPVCTLATSCGSPLGACAPGTLGCTTAVILQGRPQSPAAPFPTVEIVNNVLILTANGDYGPVAKNIHFIGKGFQNPGPGGYTISVEHTRGGDTIMSGTGRVRILPSARPSINLFTPGQNQLLQSADPGPILPWTFLVWDQHEMPFMNIELANGNNGHYLMQRDNETVGHVRINAPRRASGFSLAKTEEFTSPTPVIGLGPGSAPPPLTQRYAFQLDLGASPSDGCYATTFSLNNGNAWTLYVGVPTADACGD